MGMRVGMLLAKLLLSIFIARYMGLSDLGIFGLIVGGAATVQVMLRGGVFETFSREAVHQTKTEIVGHLRHYGTGVSLLYILLLPIAVLLGAYFGSPKIAVLMLIVFLIEHFSYDIFVLTNNLQRPKLANIVLSLQSAVWIYLFVILAFFIPSLRNLETVLLFWVGAGIITIAMAMIFTRKWPWKEAFIQPLNRAWYKENLKKSWRLYASAVMAVSVLYIDRYFIGAFLTLEILGVYVLFSQAANAICNLVGAGVLQVYRPHLIMAYKETDFQKFKQLFKHVFIRGEISTIGLSLIVALIFPFVVKYIDNPLLMDYLPLLWLMLVTLLARIAVDLYSLGVYSQKKDSLVVKTSLLRLVIYVLLMPLALMVFEIYGAVVAMLLMNIIVILYIRSCWKKTGNGSMKEIQ